MKYNKITWGLLAVFAALMVAAVGQNMGLFAFGATGLNGDVFQEGDLIIVDYTYNRHSTSDAEVFAKFAGETQNRWQRGSTTNSFTFDAPAPGTYQLELSAAWVGYKDSGRTRVYSNWEYQTFDVVVVEEKPTDYCVGNALYTDFVLVDGEWKPTPVINSPICGYTAPPPVDDTTPDEPPVDDAGDNTMFMFIALAGILVIGIVGIAYIKKR